MSVALSVASVQTAMSGMPPDGSFGCICKHCERRLGKDKTKWWPGICGVCEELRQQRKKEEEMREMRMAIEQRRKKEEEEMKAIEQRRK